MALLALQRNFVKLDCPAPIHIKLIIMDKVTKKLMQSESEQLNKLRNMNLKITL